LKKQNTDVVLQQGKLSEDICTCGELRKAARAITLLYDNTFKSSGLLSTQFGVLQVLCEIDSIQITDLAGKLGMDRTTLTRNLSVLERDGFIKISQGIDHRTRIVTATQKGHVAVSKTILIWGEIQFKVKQKLGENSWRELMLNLTRLLKVIDQLTSETDKDKETISM
jgi:DNA-binding MarR family transcriptional regulator